MKLKKIYKDCEDLLSKYISNYKYNTFLIKFFFNNN